MIYSCPNCNARFQSDTSGVVLCPSCNSKVRVMAEAQTGCSWDRAAKGGWASAFFDSVKLSIVDPVAFFSEVGEGRGMARPWIFAVVIFFVVFSVAAAYQAGFQALAVSLNLAADIEKAMIPIAALSLPLTIFAIVLLAVIIVPMFATFVVFLQSGIYHLCLMILGSARRDFSATFRTVCYTSGPQLFQIVPLLGSVVGPIWQLVLAIIGLKVVHKTTYGRSALAIFLPTILCCGALLLVIAVAAGGVAAAFLRTAVH
ncbi:MAG: YIP1 family protein [Pseudomonadota bacterium]